MNLSLFGSPIGPAHHEIDQSVEHAEPIVHSEVNASLDEGGEYMDDALRMTDQTLALD